MKKLIVLLLSMVPSITLANEAPSKFDYMRAVVFIDGPVASRVPVLKNSFQLKDALEKPEDYTNALAIMKSVYQEMETSNPELLLELKSSIESGHPYRTNNAIQLVRSKVDEIVTSKVWQVRALKDKPLTNSIESFNPEGFTLAVAVVVVAAAAVHNVVAVTSMAAVAVAVKLEVAVSKLSTGQIGIRNDLLVRDLIMDHQKTNLLSSSGLR